jgi:hypothetical protein
MNKVFAALAVLALGCSDGVDAPSSDPRRSCSQLGWACGNDDFGTVCGSCSSGTCAGGTCVGGPPTCTCAGRVCGTNSCGTASCGSCPQGTGCDNGRCVCIPNCNGRSCGSNGCGGSCGNCSIGYTCAASGACIAETTPAWTITAVGATFRGRSWDTLGGSPDPYVCLSIAGTSRCTPYLDDTFSPRWNYRFAPVSTQAIEGPISFSVGDDDYGTDDILCSGSFRLTPSNLAAGGFTINNCNEGPINFTITHR